MKRILIFLWLLPLAATAQTVHLEDERVAYHENIKVKEVSKEELYQRALAALPTLVMGTVKEEADKGKLESDAHLRMNSTHSLRTILYYKLSVDVKDGGYEYRIDSVQVTTDARGQELVVTPSKKLVSDMEITGPTAARTEKQLNEIDMRFQKLIALLRRAMTQPAPRPS